MKKRLLKIALCPVLIVGLAVSAVTFCFTGCATTAGGIAVAGGEKAGGDVYANALLDKVDPSPAGTAAQQSAISDLTAVGTDLKAFAAGTLSDTELGRVEAQLKKDGIALSSNTAALNQINSVLNIFAKAVTSVSGLVLPAQSEVQGAITNIVAGFQTAIDTHKGQWSVTNPAAWPLPPAPTTSMLQGRKAAWGSETVAFRFTR